MVLKPDTTEITAVPQQQSSRIALTSTLKYLGGGGGRKNHYVYVDIVSLFLVLSAADLSDVRMGSFGMR
jgi:hypothetical protein